MFIQKRNKENNSYKRLQEESLEMLQRLSGNRWTDFNDHDPGVTIMDILNYALLELEYSCGLPLEEYFIDAGNKKYSDENIGLFPPPEVIFASTIVTPNDYSSLILETFEEVISCSITVNNSLYTIWLKVTPNSDKNLLRSGVAALYHRNRNLCENVLEIIIEASLEQKVDSIPKKEDITYNPVDISLTFSLQENLHHRSVQYDFPPDCYGINEKGLAPDASPERKSASLQLKAYLLIYDYLLSGANQQILSIRQLMELSSNGFSEFQADVQIKDIEILLDCTRLEQAQVFDQKDKAQQKEYFFDYLDRMYGEDTYCYVNNIQDPIERNSRRLNLFTICQE